MNLKHILANPEVKIQKLGIVNKYELLNGQVTKYTDTWKVIFKARICCRLRGQNSQNNYTHDYFELSIDQNPNT